MADISDIGNIIVSFVNIFCTFGYMLLGNYLGQQIIDHSNDVFKKM